jgi:UDP-4-amino-4,6-dideoxy-N-acetyl-beta-L-altrosamine transaminase
MKLIPYGRQTIDEQDIEELNKILRSDFLTTGPKATEFEQALKEYCGAKFAIAVSSGTAALHLASLVLLNKGDKVLTTPNSFLATSNSIIYAGAQPVFVDIDVNGQIDLELCEEILKTDPTIKAIYAVSFSGKMINQHKLAYLRRTYNLLILEDNCHTLGASIEGTKAGNCKNSDISVFSFHPVKNITTGEGGAITTNSEEIYQKIVRLRNHGILKTPEMKSWEYEIHELGFNYRITDIQCALGLSQLKKLDKFITRRREIAQKYNVAFKNSLVKPLYDYDSSSAYHLFVVQVDFTKLNISREKFFQLLKKEKYISIQVHYIPINKQPYYKNLGYGDEVTPVMDKYYNECFSLPCYPLLTNEEQEYVIKSLFEVLQ